MTVSTQVGTRAFEPLQTAVSLGHAGLQNPSVTIFILYLEVKLQRSAKINSSVVFFFLFLKWFLRTSDSSNWIWQSYFIAPVNYLALHRTSVAKYEIRIFAQLVLSMQTDCLSMRNVKQKKKKLVSGSIDIRKQYVLNQDDTSTSRHSDCLFLCYVCSILPLGR